LRKFIIPYMTTEEYNKRIKELADNKGKEIIIIVGDKSEFFFAQILFRRLEKEYNWDFSQFHISFEEDLKKAQNL